MSAPNTAIALRPTSGFEAHPFTVVEIGQAPYFIAKQVGAVLGYDAAGGRMSKTIAEKWSDRLREGDHYRYATPEELAALKAIDKVPDRDPVDATVVVGAHARDLLLLTESGLYRVLMLSGKPAALAFQDWLASEVLPTLRATGSYGLQRGATADLAPVQQRLDAMANQLRELQGTLDALLPIGDRFSVADALGLIFERWYIWKANVPVTPAELCEWAFPQGDVRNAFERVLPRHPQAVSPLNPSTMKKWLTNAVGMEVQVRLAPRVTRVELRMSHGLNFWLRGL